MDAYMNFHLKWLFQKNNVDLIPKFQKPIQFNPFQMQKTALLLFMLICIKPASSQNAEYYINSTFLKMLNSEPSYIQLKDKVVAEYEHSQPGRWGEFVKGVDEDIVTQQKYIAFTFDACGGPHGDGYNKNLIELLQKEKVPAT